MSRNFHHTFAQYLMVGASLVVLAMPAHAASGLTLLNPLSGGTFATAGSVSADGSIIAGSSFSPDPHAVYWTRDGAIHDTGVIGLAYGISADATTLVGSEYHLDGTSDAWAYDIGSSTLTTLPKTIFAGPTGSADAVGASDDGSVIVGSQVDGSHHQVAVMWSGAGWTTETNLGTISGLLGSSSQAFAVSGDGSVAVGISTDSGVQSGFYWTAGAIHGLSVPAAYTSVLAGGISRDGSTIIGYATDLVTPQQHAFSWTGVGYTTATDLGTLGGNVSSAQGVSADGSIIVGLAYDAGNVSRAFRYANGTMENLNTLLTNAGVNMTGIQLSAANAISADGKYIAAFDTGNVATYLVLYDGTSGSGGITSAGAQQTSVDDLGELRQAVGVQQDAYTGLMIGDLDPVSNSTNVGGFGLYGSAAGGVKGQIRLSDEATLSGGLLGGKGDYDTLDYKGALGAIALRYDFAPINTTWRPFAQAGGSIGLLNDLSFTRTYANGGGTASGTGTTSGRAISLFVRGGAVATLGSDDQLALAAEVGERWLQTDAYTESALGNPFPASIEAGTDRQTVAKLSAGWTHNFTPAVDVTLHTAVGSVVEGSSALRVVTTGFGTLETSIRHKPWLEAGMRLGWKVSDATTLNLYATGISGETVGTSGHIGAGIGMTF